MVAIKKKSYGRVARVVAAAGFNYARRAGKKVYGKVRNAMKRKYKGSGSTTRTYSKKRKITREIDPFAGVSSSNYSEHHKCFPKAALVMKANQVSIDRLINGTRMVWGSGVQNVTVPFINFNYTDMKRIFATDLGASSAGKDTTRILIKRIHGSLRLANMTNANSEVTIYDVVARQDMAVGAPIVDPITAWNAGEYWTTGAASSTGSLVWGDTPFNSPLFCRLFKVKKVTKVGLMPGRDHVHYFSRTMNMFVNNEMLYAPGGGVLLDALGNKTHFTMIVGKGYVATDGTTHAVTAGSGEIESLIKVDIEYMYPNTELKHFNVTNTLGTITVSEAVVNDLTGAIQAFAQA